MYCLSIMNSLVILVKQKLEHHVAHPTENLKTIFFCNSTHPILRYNTLELVAKSQLVKNNSLNGLDSYWRPDFLSEVHLLSHMNQAFACHGRRSPQNLPRLKNYVENWSCFRKQNNNWRVSSFSFNNHSVILWPLGQPVDNCWCFRCIVEFKSTPRHIWYAIPSAKLTFFFKKKYVGRLFKCSYQKP